MKPNTHTIGYCPNCQSRYVCSADNTDFVHNCAVGENPALNQEDVLRLGNWQDYESSGTAHAQEVLLQGMSNDLFGTRAAVEGADFDGVTARGKNAKLYRQRNKLQYIDLKQGGC